MLFIVLLILQYRLWFESGGILDMLQLKKQTEAFQQQNTLRKERNEQLVLQVQSLRQNQDAIESRARQELGMIKKDEAYYQVVE